MIYFTSDLHFNHTNIILYEKNTRPFNTIGEMNQALIANWNEVVTNSDTVYVLGDFFLGGVDQVEAILNFLHYKKLILIRGNHDTPVKLQKYKDSGIEIKDIDYLFYKDKFFILNHFPIASEDFINMVKQKNPECILLYGHVHSKAPKGYYNGTFHVGVDTNDLKPVSIEEIWKECQYQDKICGDGKKYTNF